MRVSDLTNEQVFQLLDDLKGYANGLEKVMREYDLELEEIEELALNNNVERCEGCDWFFDSFDLVDDDDRTGFCRDCRGDSEGDE